MTVRALSLAFLGCSAFFAMQGCGGAADEEPKEIKVTSADEAASGAPAAATAAPTAAPVPICLFADITVNEIHPDGSPEDYIELLNTGATKCSLEGWELHDAKTHPDGMEHDSEKAGDALVFGAVEIAAGGLWYGESEAAGSFQFGIGKGGEQVILVSPVAQGSQKSIHYIHAYESEDGSHSLQRCTDGTYGFLPATPNAANGCASACAETPHPVCAASDVVIAEVHPDGSPEDFIEVLNTGSTTCTLDGWHLGDMKTHPDGSAHEEAKLEEGHIFGCDVVLAPGKWWYGLEDGDVANKNTFNFGVSKGGEEVILQAPGGASVILTIPEWSSTANEGESYQLCGDTYCFAPESPDAANDCTCSGTPDPSGLAICDFENIKVNEIHPDGSPEDYIELINVGTEACSLEGFQLHDAKTHVDGMAYDASKVDDILTFGAVAIEAGGLWYGESGAANSFGFGIGKSYEQVILVSPGTQKVIHYIHAYESDDGSLSLQRCDDGTYGFLPATQNAANGCASACAETALPVCAAGEVVVAEVHPDGSPEDYIEVLNIGSTTCTLDGWHLGDAKTHPDGSEHAADKLEDGHVFGCDVVLAPGNWWYGLEGDSDATTTFSFGVSKSGEEVILEPPGGASVILTVPAWDSTANAGQSYQRCGESYCFAAETQDEANTCTCA